MMMQSLTGLFRNTATALQSSKDDMACSMAFSVGQLVDNLRALKNGTATVEEFFAYYTFDSDLKCADSVKIEDYDCMQDEPADVDAD